MLHMYLAVEARAGVLILWGWSYSMCELLDLVVGWEPEHPLKESTGSPLIHLEIGGHMTGINCFRVLSISVHISPDTLDTLSFLRLILFLITCICLCMGMCK